MVPCSAFGGFSHDLCLCGQKRRFSTPPSGCVLSLVFGSALSCLHFFFLLFLAWLRIWKPTRRRQRIRFCCHADSVFRHLSTLDFLPAVRITAIHPGFPKASGRLLELLQRPACAVTSSTALFGGTPHPKRGALGQSAVHPSSCCQSVPAVPYRRHSGRSNVSLSKPITCPGWWVVESWLEYQQRQDESRQCRWQLRVLGIRQDEEARCQRLPILLDPEPRLLYSPHASHIQQPATIQLWHWQYLC